MDVLDDIIKKSQPIPETTDFDSENFKKKYINKRKPVLLKGYANNWKAKQKWSFEFLSNLKIDEAVRIEFGNVIQNESKVKYIDFKAYIDQIINHESGNEKDKPYLSQFDFFDYFPDLMKDTDLSILTNHTKINWPGAWIGPKGTISGFHWDSGNNILTQIRGRKRVILASCKYQKEMYPSKKYDYDACGSLVDIHNFDEVKFSKFKNVEFYSFILEPGDTLFIPWGWWHYLQSLDASVSVSNFSYSFKDLPRYYKELIGVKLHNRGYYRTKECTCHEMIEGKRVGR